MNLGEKIYNLRTKENLSQGDLADRLNVSRQSISKWENNTSIPDLDKIIKLSEIFKVTVDELVKEGELNIDLKVEEEIVTSSKSKGHTVGIVLLALGFFLTLLFAVLGGGFIGLFLASPIFISGLICVFNKSHPYLYSAWVTYVLVDIYFRLATGISWKAIYSSKYYLMSNNYIQVIMAWLAFILLLMLVIVTIKTFLPKSIEVTKKKVMFVVFGIVLYLVSMPMERAIMMYFIDRHQYAILSIIQMLFDYAMLVLGIWIVLCGIRMIREHRKRRINQL